MDFTDLYFQNSNVHNRMVLTASYAALLHTCNWFVCISRATISAVSVCLYLPFVPFVCFSVFYSYFMAIID